LSNIDDHLAYYKVKKWGGKEKGMSFQNFVQQRHIQDGKQYEPQLFLKNAME